MILSRIRILAIFISLSCLWATAAEPILGIDGEEASSIGIFIKDIRTGEVLVDHNGQMALTPASVMKAVTTATALSVYGPDKTFQTNVLLRGRKEGATYCGDIVVQGVADPTLESDNFKSNLGFIDGIIAALKQKGISKVTGTVVVDQSLKDAGPNTKWEIEDIAWPYGAALFGFNWRDNSARLFPASGKTIPHVPGLEVCLNKVDAPNDIVRGVYSDRLMVYSRNPKDPKWETAITVPDPAAVFLAECINKINAAGISIGDKAAAPGAETAVLYTHTSPRFSAIMKSLMVRSDNLFAEGMLRVIEPAESRAKAIKRLREIWATRGINPRYTIINDGCGLTRANKLSPHFLADVLEWMAKSDMSKTYTDCFPRAGKDGTLRGFLAKTPLVGKVALKTGSVSSVQCYAGYRLANDGTPTHVIVMMVNGFFCPRRDVRVACEDLLLRTFNED